MKHKRVLAGSVCLAVLLCACAGRGQTPALPAGSPAPAATAATMELAPLQDAEGTVYGAAGPDGYCSVVSTARADGSLNIRYTDYASMQTVYLCAQPNCAHDSESCTSYQPGETIPSVSGDITLFAQWEGTGPLTSFIEYYNNAPYPPAYNMPAPTPVTGGAAVISTQIPMRQGYTFAGWNTSPEGIGITYQPGQAVAGLDAGLGLYAMWMPDGSGGNDCGCSCTCGCSQERCGCNFRPECWCHQVC